MTASPVTAPSKPASEDGGSDHGSDGSSVSLISIPSSSDDDLATWEDSRSHVEPERARTGMEYVVLYDDSSEESE